MNDIAMGVNNFDEMIPALMKIFDCLRALGLKCLPINVNLGLSRLIICEALYYLKESLRKLTK